MLHISFTDKQTAPRKITSMAIGTISYAQLRKSETFAGNSSEHQYAELNQHRWSYIYMCKYTLL